MVNWWQADPVFKAMDIQVIYPENYGAVVAASGKATEYLDISDADGFPTHLCGYSRISFGYTSKMINQMAGQIPPDAPMGGIPKPLFLLSQGLVCDARVKWFQALGRYMDVPVWVMETPTPGVEEWAKTETRVWALELIVNEIKKFITYLEQILGRKMDWDRYDEIVYDTIELCRIAHDTFQLRQAKPCPMHSKDFWSTMPAYLFMIGDLKESIKLYQDMYNEVKIRVANGISAVDPEKYRLVFGDIPPWHSLNFFDKLAEKGWNFVKESWGYNPPLPQDSLEEIKDPLRRHARFHMHFLTGYYEKALHDKEFTGSMGYPYYQFAKDYKCDGAVFHSLITCRSASTHHPYTQDLLLRKLMVPSLNIEGDLVDLRIFDEEEALRRAEAFEETMDYYREERKKIGLDW
jgi:benzoyl-CoA reductase/2-hydroxyglutaryl-CoA dehydratase subunit BcrC/BadD/HgdB